MDPVLRKRILQWSVWLIVAVSLLAVFSVGIVSATQPACESCHTAREMVAKVTIDAHVDADCVTCHVGGSPVDRVKFGYYQTFGMILPVVPVADSAAAAVPDERCGGCHEQLPGVTETGGLRVQHESCAEGSTCVSCHSDTAHGTQISWPSTYSMDTCLGCHSAKEASTDCETCHTGSLDKKNKPSGPWSVTHGPQWKQTHGMGDMATCRACHAEDYCGRCHGAGVPHDQRFFESHGRQAKGADAKCGGCHQKTFCTDCHGTPMPHPKKFTQGHSKLVKAKGDEDCMKCHIEEDCTTCHVKHVHPGGAIPRPKLSGN